MFSWKSIWAEDDLVFTQGSSHVSHAIKTTSQLALFFELSPYLDTLTFYIAFGYYINYFSQNFF